MFNAALFEKSRKKKGGNNPSLHQYDSWIKLSKQYNTAIKEKGIKVHGVRGVVLNIEVLLIYNTLIIVANSCNQLKTFKIQLQKSCTKSIKNIPYSSSRFSKC